MFWIIAIALVVIGGLAFWMMSGKKEDGMAESAPMQDSDSGPQDMPEAPAEPAEPVKESVAAAPEAPAAPKAPEAPEAPVAPEAPEAPQEEKPAENQSM